MSDQQQGNNGGGGRGGRGRGGGRGGRGGDGGGVCYHFQQGNCRFGDQCTRSHEAGAGGRGDQQGTNTGHGEGCGGRGGGEGEARGEAVSSTGSEFMSDQQQGDNGGGGRGGRGRGGGRGAGHAGHLLSFPGGRGICYHFQQGNCRFGDRCTRSHEAGAGGRGDQQGTNTGHGEGRGGRGGRGGGGGRGGRGGRGGNGGGICYHFQQGNCRYGDQCPKSHEAGAGGRGGGGGPSHVNVHGNITGVVSTVGNGLGRGPGQFNLIGITMFRNRSSMYQVSFGSDSTVWAVDCQGHRVHHFKQSGELIKTIGTGTAGNGPGQLGHPKGVAVSRLGSSVFISEDVNNRISEFNQSDGAFVRVLDTPGLADLCAISLSPDETTLAVACTNSHCIKLVSVDGSVASRTIGGEKGSEDGQLKYPLDVRFTPDGQQLVVADRNNRRVQCLALDGSFVRKIPLGGNAFAVAVDAAGNIIATTGKHVKVFSPEGTLLHNKLGKLDMGAAAFSGLAIDPSSGRIAVGDREVGKVNLLGPVGQVELARFAKKVRSEI